MNNHVQNRPQRQVVLGVADGQFIEFYAERNIDLCIIRVPQGGTPATEDLAEQCLEAAIPLRYRPLFDRRFLRANAFIAPLPADVAQDSFRLKRIVAALNKWQEGDAA